MNLPNNINLYTTPKSMSLITLRFKSILPQPSHLSSLSVDSSPLLPVMLADVAKSDPII